MTTSSSPARRALTSGVTLAGGVSVAVTPAATLSISSRTFSLDDQGVVAVAVMIATFLGQVVFAALVESRLSAPGERRVRVPGWLVVAAIAAAAAVVIRPSDVLVLCVTLPVLFAALEVGRGVSIAERLDYREGAASMLIGLGAAVGVLVALSGGGGAFIPLALGIVAATLVRVSGVGSGVSPLHPKILGWVVADVSITGVMYPLINIAILASIGPVSSVLFTAISTVSGLLSIPLNFMRLRLLKEHSLLDILVTLAALVLALAAITVAEAVGLFAVFFGRAWTTEDTIIPLAIACAWRAASLATTLPFAALRRRGEVRLVTILRAASAIVTLGAALAAVSTQLLPIIFAALLLGELLQALLYESARHRVGLRA